MPFRPLKSFFSTADELLRQDLPTLGAVLLAHLKSYEGLNTVYQYAGLNRGYFRAMLDNRNVGLGSLPREPEYGIRQPEVATRMMEAWNWLERQGLLIRNDEQVADWFIVSREGEELLKSGALSAMKKDGAKDHSMLRGDSLPFRWEDLDNRLLSPKLQELSNEMQTRSVEGERKAAFDTRQSGNSAGYLPRLFDFQEQLTDEWVQRAFAAHCESWSQQNRIVTGDFVRAVRDRAILPIIAARKSAVQFEVSLRGTRIGENPNPVSLAEWNRRMDRLAARWSQRLESDAVAEEYRASRPSDVRDDRYFALLAIEEAKKSVAEDDRPHPKVGAVVVKDGKVLTKAHRGENPKSHAEYIALEEKLSSETLAGATVYTTLEPCTKRNPPKICCAQRLVDRRVARVFIGMLDPNADIRGLGEQLLSDAGIDTQLFPRDLKVQVEEMNRAFIRDQKEKWRSRTSTTSVSRDEFKNPQIKSEFLGEYPDGPTLWITSDREIMLTQLDYLDLHEAKVDSDKAELSGQDFRLPIDHAKLVRINNLMHAGGRPFRMKFRVEITAEGRSISHVIPAIIEPAMKPIQGTMTGFMRIVGSTTGYAL